MIVRYMFCILIAAAATSFAPPADAQAPGDATQGKATAERWCTTCHVVSAGGRGSDVAPNFAAIARSRDDSYLYAFLSKPHPPMPRFELSRQDIADLISYFAALRQQQ